MRQCTTYQTNFTVSVAGENLPIVALASYTNYTLCALDISGFSGQTAEIRFTAYPDGPPGVAMYGVYLDDIRFSSSLVAAPPFILRPPQNQWAYAGSPVRSTGLCHC